MDLHHPLLAEFPEYRDAIHTLKMKDAHFHRLFDEYHDLDKRVSRIEEEIEVATDKEMQRLKKRRAALKDDLHEMIVKSGAKPAKKAKGA
jgi:uncharacterized protein YdcH (DUF465 family)